MLGSKWGWRVGAFRLDCESGELRGPSGLLRLEPRVQGVLERLLEAPGEVVSRKTLLEDVWPGLVVGDEALTRCVSELRTAFGDGRRAPRYIQTIPKRGYRLIAPIEAIRERSPRRLRAGENRPLAGAPGQGCHQPPGCWCFCSASQL